LAQVNWLAIRVGSAALWRGRIFMRHGFTAIALVTALTMGAAHAAPDFGASSHRLGGVSKPAEKERNPLALFELALGLIGFDLSASVEPVVGETLNDSASRAKKCDQAKDTEVAKAETKNGSDTGSSKGRARNGEPVYLAF
jgi:hypothetical protein